jgi:hypothetical protein
MSGAADSNNDGVVELKELSDFVSSSFKQWSFTNRKQQTLFTAGRYTGGLAMSLPDKLKICRPHEKKLCFDKDVYWANSCGETEDLAENCENKEGICEDGKCNCPENASLDRGNDMCVCNKGYKMRNGACEEAQAKAECPLNAAWNEFSQSCKCIDGFQPVGNTCVEKQAECQFNSAWDPDTKSCRCLPGSHWENQKCISNTPVCGENSSWDPAAGKCNCYANYGMKDGICTGIAILTVYSKKFGIVSVSIDNEDLHLYYTEFQGDHLMYGKGRVFVGNRLVHVQAAKMFGVSDFSQYIDFNSPGQIVSIECGNSCWVAK